MTPERLDEIERQCDAADSLGIQGVRLRKAEVRKLLAAAREVKQLRNVKRAHAAWLEENGKRNWALIGGVSPNADFGRFYQAEAELNAALVAIGLPKWSERLELQRENAQLRADLEAARAEVQRLSSTWRHNDLDDLP